MVKKFFKKKSKRMTCATKYKIRHKIAEHHKKVKKANNLKNSTKNSQRKRKIDEYTIPNSYPYKEELLNKAMEVKEQIKLEKKLKKAKTTEVTARNTEIIKEKTKTTYGGHFNTVLKQANVILLVLDARDPLGTSACFNLSNLITTLHEGQKRLIIVLNKIDLVPKENYIEWIKYFKSMAPTIPFKASQQKQQKNLGDDKLNPKSSSTIFGREQLMHLFANYARNGPLFTSRKELIIGVVGMPNVGKSSLINSMKRKKVCEQGSIPGITKHLQTIKLQQNISMIDSPGVIFPQQNLKKLAEKNDDFIKNEFLVNDPPFIISNTPMDISLQNVLKIEDIEDPIGVITQIIAKCGGIATLEKKYKLIREPLTGLTGVDMDLDNMNSLNSENKEKNDDCNTFLTSLAKRLGKLKKGGIPDIEASARHVIQDWNQGKIPYFSQVPARSINGENDKGMTLIDSAIVNTWSKEFDIEGLLNC